LEIARVFATFFSQILPNLMMRFLSTGSYQGQVGQCVYHRRAKTILPRFYQSNWQQDAAMIFRLTEHRINWHLLLFIYFSSFSNN
jgi:hypothetical protein